MASVLPRPSIKDRQRWYLWRAEKPVEEIAARDRVGVDAIKASIDKVEAYRYIASAEEVDMAYNMMALELVDSQKRVLRDAMLAKRIRVNTDGNEVKEIDHDTRLKALDSAREFASVARPKGPGIQINTQNNVNGGGSGGHTGNLSFEAILREKRAERERKLLASPSIPMLEAEFEDSGPSNAELAARDFEEMGIELEDEDFSEEDGNDDGD